MKRSLDHILTTHAGSLVRPAELRTQEDGMPETTGKPRDDESESRLRDAVAAVVAKQAEVGLDAVNDGEYGKTSWSTYILERISGFEISDRLVPLVWLGRDRDRFREFFEEEIAGSGLRGGVAEVCKGPIEYITREPIERDLKNLRAAAVDHPDRDYFFTAVAPASTAFNGINEFYRTEEEYVFAIAKALREEYRAIHDAGFLLQIDDAVLANMYDYLVEQSPEAYRKWAGLRVEALNFALEGIPEDRVRYHVCFGSWHVPHVADAPLEAIIDLILQVNAGAYSIEAGNVRHEHEWEIWETRKLPDGKILIPGVVSHHTLTVEHPRLVAQRIERFTRLLGPENVIAGTDCGFAQAAFLQRVHPSIMWAKLSSLVEGAQLASSRIWKR